jgi:hypothetical protein
MMSMIFAVSFAAAAVVLTIVALMGMSAGIAAITIGGVFVLLTMWAYAEGCAVVNVLNTELGPSSYDLDIAMASVGNVVQHTRQQQQQQRQLAVAAATSLPSLE